MENSPDNVQRINLGEVLDISTVSELKSKLVAVLENRGSVVLEANEIEKADTSALQVLMAFVQDARVQKQNVKWYQPSQALIRSAGFIGLRELLGFVE